MITMLAGNLLLEYNNILDLQFTFNQIYLVVLGGHHIHYVHCTTSELQVLLQKEPQMLMTTKC